MVLITQRSQVQILPPLPNQQVRGLSRFRERPSCATCAREIRAQVRHAPERDACPQSVASLLRQPQTLETAVAESLGACPEIDGVFALHSVACGECRPSSAGSYRGIA